MRNRTIPLSKFRLGDFLAAYTEFYRGWSGADEDGSVAVYLLDNLGDTPVRSSYRPNHGLR